MNSRIERQKRSPGNMNNFKHGLAPFRNGGGDSQRGA
jgi:hypothetical protein